MTMDAMKASHFDDSSAQIDEPFSMTSNMSMVYVGNSAHVVEPVISNEAAGVPDEYGMPSLLSTLIEKFCQTYT